MTQTDPQGWHVVKPQQSVRQVSWSIYMMYSIFLVSHCCILSAILAHLNESTGRAYCTTHGSDLENFFTLKCNKVLISESPTPTLWPWVLGHGQNVFMWWASMSLGKLPCHTCPVRIMWLRWLMRCHIYSLKQNCIFPEKKAKLCDPQGPVVQS